jgi:predicted aspartyl protease
MRRALAGLLLCSGCNQMAPGTVQAPADSASGEVSFELAGPQGAALIVPVSINGHGPYDFVLDTGATLTCIDQALADSLTLASMPGAVGIGAGVGSQGQLRLVRFDSVRVGAAMASSVPGCVVDLSHVQNVGVATSGLLGLNFLRSFHVTLDFERSVLILQDPAAAR